MDVQKIINYYYNSIGSLFIEASNIYYLENFNASIIVDCNCPSITRLLISHKIHVSHHSLFSVQFTVKLSLQT